MAEISFNIACKELKIKQIAQLNQLFQFLHLVHISGHGWLSRMLMSTNVNNDVVRDHDFSVLKSLPFSHTRNASVALRRRQSKKWG